MKQETKELVTKEANELSTEVNSAWGAGDNIDVKDILLPKILCAQAMSKAVLSQDVSMGDFYDSVEKKILDKMVKNSQTKLEILVFDMFKTWVTFHDGEYVSTEFHTRENADYPYSETVDGVEIKRDSVLNFYCLLPSEISECAEAAFPYVFPFKRTSRLVGQKLTSMFAKWKAIGKPSAWKLIEITRTLETGDKGTYFVMDSRVGRDATQEEISCAYSWYKRLQGRTNVRIDDSDYTVEDVVENVEESEF